MDREKFTEALRKGMTFIRIHRWVSQTEDHIKGLKQAVTDNPGLVEDFRQVIRDELAEATDTSEKMFALSILGHAGADPVEVAEILFNNFQGVLTLGEFQFFSRHFFYNQSPLPHQLTIEITEGVFLTFHRAILQALKVTGFESKVDSPHVMLYLTALLCRNKLFEQNRAMVYLLLSRIDTPMPETVRTAVLDAITRLKDVIQEVEQRKDKVLSDEYRPDEQNQAGSYWDTASAEHGKPGEARKPPVEVKSPVREAQAFDYGGSWNPADSVLHGGTGVMKPRKPQGPGPEAEKPGIPDFDSRPAIESAVWSADKSAAVGDRTGPSRKAPDSKVPEAPVTGQEPGRPAESGLDRAWAGIESSSMKEPYTAPAKKNVPAAPASETSDVFDNLSLQPAISGVVETGPTGTETFIISFSQVTKELEEVIDLLKNGGKPKKVKSGGELDADGNPVEQPSGLHRIKGIFRTRLSKRGMVTLMIVAGLVLLVVIILLVAGNSHTSSRPEAPGGGSSGLAAVAAPVDAHGETAEKAPAPAGGAATVTGAAATGKISVGGGTDTPAKTDPDLRKDSDGKTYWVPRKGETVWDLYLWQRHSRGLSGTVTGVLEDTRRWLDFLARLQEMNPGLARPELIFPGQTILLDSR